MDYAPYVFGVIVVLLLMVVVNRLTRITVALERDKPRS